MDRRTLLLGLSAAPLASALATQTESSTAGPRASYFPNVELWTHEGEKVRFYDDLVKGNRIVVFNMMYVHCEGICPGVTANLVRVQKLLQNNLGRDVFMYSITLKPQEDTPESLKEYAQMHGVKPGWLFLTGKPADIEQLRRKLGFQDPDPAFDADTRQHIGLIRFGNESLDRWAACPAEAVPEQIVKSILWMKAPNA